MLLTTCCTSSLVCTRSKSMYMCILYVIWVCVSEREILTLLLVFLFNFTSPTGSALSLYVLPIAPQADSFFWTAESQKAASGSHHSIEFYFALLCLPHRWHYVAVVVYVIPLSSHSDAFRSTPAPPSVCPHSLAPPVTAPSFIYSKL